MNKPRIYFGAESLHASQHLQQIIARNRAGERVGTYAVCSAHPSVIDAAIHQALEDNSILHVESTSSQVNQFGGYTGTTPQQFADGLRQTALASGLASDRILIGADHLGPYFWRREPSATAMEKSCELARHSVRAGYQKIHLDASMPCADDGDRLDEGIIAQRAAVLCEAAERECQNMPAGSPPPLYVIGTEVPTPGGEVAEGHGPEPTRVHDVQRSMEEFRKAFHSRGLHSAWERVIALVVQPGVEFGDADIFDYDRSKAHELSTCVLAHPPIAYEAHSTDYQTPANLANLVEDHFAILKVGPWLTFAYREAIFGLAAIEQELLGAKRGVRLSNIREALDAEMLRDPVYWQPYYRGDDNDLRLARAYSFSDRCRYYWCRPSVQQAVDSLVANLAAVTMPLTLLSQFVPSAYEPLRSGQIASEPNALVRHHIQQVLRVYAAACSSDSFPI